MSDLHDWKKLREHDPLSKRHYCTICGLVAHEVAGRWMTFGKISGWSNDAEQEAK